MDASLEQEIRSAFPHLLGSDAEFRFGNGWFVLTWMLLQQIERNKWPVLLGTCHEKWGWLHVRMSHDMSNCPLDIEDAFYTATFLTEYNSYKICEECAEPGIIRWNFKHVKVLCDDCEKAHDAPSVEQQPQDDTKPGDWRVERAAGYATT